MQAATTGTQQRSSMLAPLSSASVRNHAITACIRSGGRNDDTDANEREGKRVEKRTPSRRAKPCN